MNPIFSKLGISLLSVLIFLVCSWTPVYAQKSWECRVFPIEAKTIVDPTSGAKLVFVTSATDEDTNLYFHQRSWLPDESMLVFHRKQDKATCYWGYLESTGELVRLHDPGLSLGYEGSCSRYRNSLFVILNNEVHEWLIKVEQGEYGKPSRVSVEDNLVGKLPDDVVSTVGLNENSDGSGIMIGFNSKGPTASRIILMDYKTGECKELASLNDGISHIQSSWVTPDLALFCRSCRVSDRAGDNPQGIVLARMWLTDSSEREPWPLYPQLDGELVTHECWWVDNQVTFCSGMQKAGYAEEAHVKVIDIETGIARIIGAGAWWPGGSPKEVSKRNWWHCAGSPTGKFAMADNWHGDIGIFSAKTSRTRLLTENHRTYGQGPHPHAGWAPSGTKVVFTSNLHGNPDVVIGVLPEEWIQNEW